jgi:hypothetical protein
MHHQHRPEAADVSHLIPIYLVSLDLQNSVFYSKVKKAMALNNLLVPENSE